MTIEVLARDVESIGVQLDQQDKSILEVLRERFGSIWVGHTEDGKFEIDWYGPPTTPEDVEYGGGWRCATGETFRGALLAALWR